MDEYYKQQSNYAQNNEFEKYKAYAEEHWNDFETLINVKIPSEYLQKVLMILIRIVLSKKHTIRKIEAALR